MPTKEDYITQIKADLETDDGETSEVLNERLQMVEAAESDADAQRAYFDHLEQVRTQAEDARDQVDTGE